MRLYHPADERQTSIIRLKLQLPQDGMELQLDIPTALVKHLLVSCGARGWASEYITEFLIALMGLEDE